MIKLTRYGHAIRQLQPRWTSLQHVKNATTGWRRIRAYRTRPSGNRPFGTSSSSPSTTSSWRNTNVAHGVAVAVVGDKIILKDLARGAVGNIVRFENGSEALVMEVLENGEINAIVTRGVKPTASEICDVVQERPMFPITSAIFGGVLSPSGMLVESFRRNTQHRNEKPLNWPLLQSSQTFQERELARDSGALFTQQHVVDVFHPLIRGSATLITSDENLETGNYIRTLSSGAAQNEPIHVVYAAIGHSESMTGSIIENLIDTHDKRQVTVIAAPDTSSLGEQYLAPFAAEAVGAYLRSCGKHALVVYDNLTNHFEISRQCVNLDWNKVLATPSHHGFLFDSCYKAKNSEGSMTCIALAEGSPQEGPGVPTSEAAAIQMSQKKHDNVPSFAGSRGSEGHDIASLKKRGYLSLLLSLAHNTFHIGQINAQGDWQPYDEDALIHRMGFVSTGSCYHKYANRVIHIFRQLRLLARDSAQAYAHGIEFEADLDQLLAYYLKLKLILFEREFPEHRHFNSDFEAAEFALTEMLAQERPFPHDKVDPVPDLGSVQTATKPATTRKVAANLVRQYHSSAVSFSTSDDDEKDNAKEPPEIPTSAEFEERMKKLEEKLDPAQKQAFAHVRAKKEKERRKRFNAIPKATPPSSSSGKNRSDRDKQLRSKEGPGSTTDDHESSPFSSDSPLLQESDTGDEADVGSEPERDHDKFVGNESVVEDQASDKAEERKLKILRMKAQREAQRRTGESAQNQGEDSEQQGDGRVSEWIPRVRELIESTGTSHDVLSYRRKDPGLFAMLFAFSHGYCRAVPVHKIREYSRGLINTLGSSPTPSGVPGNYLLTSAPSTDDTSCSFDSLDIFTIVQHTPVIWNTLAEMDEADAVDWLLSSGVVDSAEASANSIANMPSFWRAYHDIVRSYTAIFLLDQVR